LEAQRNGATPEALKEILADIPREYHEGLKNQIYKEEKDIAYKFETHRKSSMRQIKVMIVPEGLRSVVIAATHASPMTNVKLIGEPLHVFGGQTCVGT
jgi:hypothetical protein